MSEARSAATPWCSLERAVAAAPSGSVVRVRGGEYPPLVVSGDLARTDFVTLEAAPGEVPTMPGLRLTRTSYLRFRGFKFTDKVAISEYCSNIAMVGNTVENLAVRTLGIGVAYGSRDILIEGNDIHVPNGYGFNLSSNYDLPEITNVTVRGNHFHGIGSDAMQLKRYRNLLVEGNEIEGVRRYISTEHSDVIQSVYGGSGLTIRNNFFHDNEAGIIIKDGGVDDLVIENNLIVRTANTHALDISNARARIVNNTIWRSGYGIALHATQAGLVGVSQITLLNNVLPNIKADTRSQLVHEDYNIVAVSPYGQGAHDLVGLPVFVDPDRDDFRLAAGSPGIDAGTTETAPAHDRRGHPRYDVRAQRNRGGSGRVVVDIGSEEVQGRVPARPSLGGPKRQRLRRGEVSLTCGPEVGLRCTPSGHVSIAGTRRRYPLALGKRSRLPDHRVSLVMKLSKRGAQAVDRALGRGRTVVAVVRVAGIDGAGNARWQRVRRIRIVR